MTIKPLKSTEQYLQGRPKEIFRNAIMDGDVLQCTISSPYRNKLKLITETVLKTLEDEQQGKVLVKDT